MIISNLATLRITFPSVPPMCDYLSPLPHFLLADMTLSSRYVDPDLVPGQIISIEWHQRPSRPPAAYCCSTCTINYQIIEIEWITDQILHIIIATSSHSLRGLLQMREKLLYETKMTVNQVIWFIKLYVCDLPFFIPPGGLGPQRVKDTPTPMMYRTVG